MNTDEKTTKMEMRVKLSTLWIVVMFNMVFADIVGFMNPGALEKIMTGVVEFEITQELLLVFSILLEIPIGFISVGSIFACIGSVLHHTEAPRPLVIEWNDATAGWSGATVRVASD